ncbi:MAG TPA: hypothetical protein VFV05_09570 [Methylomirabilota bacterium]|nr:hypothetical protein [Methylomirabilota bacterium]
MTVPMPGSIGYDGPHGVEEFWGRYEMWAGGTGVWPRCQHQGRKLPAAVCAPGSRIKDPRCFDHGATGVPPDRWTWIVAGRRASDP